MLNLFLFSFIFALTSFSVICFTLWLWNRKKINAHFDGIEQRRQILAAAELIRAKQTIENYETSQKVGS